MTQQDNDARLVAAIDFETYYSTKDGYTLSALTPYEYTHDARFDAYLVAVAFSDKRPTFVGNPKDFDWSSVSGAQLLAHNAAFDGMVLRRLEELGIVPEEPRDWLDTADMVAFLGVTRNLKNACKELLGLEVSKAVRTAMDGKTDRDLSPSELEDLLEYGGSDADECLRLFVEFGDKWPEWERRISTQNREAAWRGIAVDTAAVEAGLAALAAVQDKAVRALPWVIEGKPAGSLPALTEAVRALGLPVPPSFRKNDPRFLEWAKEHGDKCPFLQARIDYASVTPHIARLQNLAAHLSDGLYHSDVRYFGTHTGRTASGTGRESESASKINLLNLPKAAVFGVDMRGMFVPRPGYKFIIYDYGQIEARVIKWLAGDSDFVEMLAQEGNIYQAEAVKMGWAQPKGPSLKKTNKQLYQLAKACCLGLGYGMSAGKFILSCKSMGLELDPLPVGQWPEIDRRLQFILANQAGICNGYDKPENVAAVGTFLRFDGIVSEWRRANRKVVDYWRSLENALRKSATAELDVHYFRLPSGRLKPYFRPRIKAEPKVYTDPETGQPKTQVRQALTAAVIKDRPAVFFHGGSLAENITQATARDLMAQGAVDIERMYPQCKFMWSCYDEVIFEAPESECEELSKAIPGIMCNGPSISEWIDCKLPLEVEGGVFDRYCK